MELEGQWWRGQLAADIHQALRYKVIPMLDFSLQCFVPVSKNAAPWEVRSLVSRPERVCLLIWSRLINFLVSSLGCIRRTCNLNEEGGGELYLGEGRRNMTLILCLNRYVCWLFIGQSSPPCSVFAVALGCYVTSVHQFPSLSTNLL